MVRHFTYLDFVQYGKEYDVTHCLPEAIVQDASRHRETLASGTVHEQTLCPGVTLLHTDLQFMVPYHAHSSLHDGYSFALLLSGQLRIGRERAPLCTVGPACGINTCYGNERMQTHYLPGTRLAALDVVVDQAKIEENAYTEKLLPVLDHAPAAFAVAAQDNAFLDSVKVQLALAQDQSVSGLVYEALGLQLLARARAGGANPGLAACRISETAISRHDHEKLDDLRQFILEQPWLPHSIQSLALQSGLGESALRKKFQLKFGQSIMAWVRQARLQLAQRYLEQGESVEKVASLAGYRHASNFSSAYKKQFGINPSRRQAPWGPGVSR